MTRAVPNQFGSLTNPSLPNLDADFTALTPTVVLPCTVTGTNALTLTPISSSLTVSAYTDKDRYSFVAGATSTGVMTAQVGSLTSVKVFKAGGTTQAASGDVVSGQYYDLAFQSALDSNNGGFVIVSAIAAASVSQQTVNPQSGTSYTVVAGDNTKLITFTSGIAVSLPAAQGTFAASFYADLATLSSSTGTVTITTVSGLINGATSLQISPGRATRVVADAGGNWQLVPYFAGSVTLGTENVMNPVSLSANATAGHGMIRKPDYVYLWLENLTAEVGYAVGDRVPMAQGSVTGTNSGAQVTYTQSSTIITTSAAVAVVNRVGFTTATITAANWKLVAQPVIFNGNIFN